MQSASQQGSPPGVPYDRSMAARFGQLILSDGIAAIPVVLYYKQAQLDLLAQEVWFVSAILARKWDAELPYPDLQEMADNSGTTARQLRRYRANLESRGHLRVAERYDPDTGRRLPNSYDFRGLFAQMETLLATDPVPANEIRAEDTPRTTPDTPVRDYSFVARYGRVIAAAGIAAIPKALFTYQRALQLSAVQVWFTSYILAHRWSTDLPYPSLRLMAARTHYSERHLHDVKDSLVAAGYLRVIGRIGPQGSQDTNAYDFAGLLAALTAHIEGINKPPMVSTTPASMAALAEAAGNQEAIAEETEGGTSTWTPRVRRGQHRPPARQAASNPPHRVPVQPTTSGHPDQMETRTSGSVGTRTDSSEGKGTYSSVDNRTLRSETSRTQHSERNRTARLGGTRTSGSDEKEPIQEEPIQEEPDSNHVTRQKNPNDVSTATPRYSPYIAAVILDYSRELGDAVHGPANVTQAAHLWRESGLSEEAFVEQLHKVRMQVRLYQGKQGFGYIENKMAYFFRTLRDLMQLPPSGTTVHKFGKPKDSSG